MRQLASIAATMLLIGCAAAGSETRPAMCDWVVPYARDVQDRAADELQRHDVPTLRRLIEDYGELRARIRSACR